MNQANLIIGLLNLLVGLTILTNLDIVAKTIGVN